MIKLLVFVGMVIVVAFLVISLNGLNNSIKFSNENPATIMAGSLTLHSLFDHSYREKNNKLKKTTLLVTGDIVPGRSVNYNSAKYNDFRWAYLKTAEFLKNADITFVNYEVPLIDDCPLTMEGMVFCGDKRNVEGLVFSGVDVANLANNHSSDKGEDGVINTVSLLNNRGILTTGVDGAVYKEVNGIKFAFLGYDDIASSGKNISFFNEDKTKGEILEAKRNSDVVIVAMHWGVEYRSQPDQRQQYLAHFVIDAGADLVIGNHPHWIQPIEVYKGKLVTYAHGNFIFDQMWSEETKIGAPAVITFCGKSVCDIEYFPVKIENYGQPYMLEGVSKASVTNTLVKESIKLRDSLD